MGPSSHPTGNHRMGNYAGVWSRASRLAERATIVYGDFAVSPGPERKGGPPTQTTLKNGDLFILDFSVVLFGYRLRFHHHFGRGRTVDSRPVR